MKRLIYNRFKFAFDRPSLRQLALIPSDQLRSCQRVICPAWIELGCFLAGFCLTLLLGNAPAIAQFSLPANQGAQSLPSGVERIGQIEVTSLYFNGSPIFKIAAPTVLNRENPDTLVPVEVRARDIEANLQRLIAVDPNREPANQRPYSTFLDPETVKVTQEIINEQPVLLVKDAYLSQPETIITVTDADARYNYTTKQEVADRWQAILEREFRQALAMRQPDALKQQAQEALWIGLRIGLITVLVLGLLKFLGWRKQILDRQQTAIAEQIQTATAVVEAAATTERPHLPETLAKQQFVLKLRLQLIGIFRWFFYSFMAFVWLLGIGGILRLFPWTRRYSYLTNAPILILVAWFLAGLIDRVANLLIDRFTTAWRQGEFLATEVMTQVDNHRDRRISTVTSAVKWLKASLIYLFATLLVLQSLGVSTGSVLAIGAIFALAVSFAAQSLVKDLVNGFLILLEDQYAVGDVVQIAGAAGAVETINLRITQLRNAEGRLITIPNSQITQVENLTRNWSRIDFAVEVAYATDVDKALKVLHDLTADFYSDPQWRPLILERPEVLGVDGIHHHGLLIRVWIKTVPLQQWKVAREFRRRVKIAFDECQIQIGAPQQIWISSNDQEITNLPDALTVGKDPEPSDEQGNTSTVIGKV